jgi:putative ABC transport system permease protein
MNVMRSFTLRSLKRNKKRTIVTIIGVVISVAMITAVTTLLYSFLDYLQRGTIADSGNWHARFTQVRAADLDKITESGKVDQATLSRDVGFAQIPDSGSYSKQYLYLREYSAGGFDQMSIRLTEGRLPQSAGEVLISQSLLQGSDLNYQIGDTLTLEIGGITDAYGMPLKGNDYTSEAYDEAGNVIGSPTFTPRGEMTLTIVGVMEAPGFESSWSTGYGLLGYLDEASLSPDDRIDVYITVPRVTRAIYQDVNKLVSDIGDSETGAEFNDDILRYYGVVQWDNVYNFLQGFMLVIILIIVIASVSLIYNAFAMSVSERARQLGLLASVGATKRQKRASVYFEGFFVGAIGIPVGILAGLGGIGVTLAAIQPLMDSFISVSGNVKLTLVVSPAALIATVLFSWLQYSFRYTSLRSGHRRSPPSTRSARRRRCA